MIAAIRSWLARRPTFARGIHPPTSKSATADLPVEVLADPPEVLLPLHQHAGAPAVSVARPRMKLNVGDLVGSAAAGNTSANVHASISGTAKPITTTTLPNGRQSLALPIKRNGEPQTEVRSLWETLLGGTWTTSPLAVPPEQIRNCVFDAGIVGLGGAAFPTHLKLAPTRPMDTVVLNGCECEPYLTADYRLMLEAPDPIVAGLQIAMRAVGAGRGVIAIEDNKMAAVDSIQKSIDRIDNIEVAVCATKYPMGGERQLIPALFGYSVPTGGFPTDIGIVVLNVGTAAAVAGAVLRGNKLTHRIVSVSGRGVVQPGNWLVPIGTRISDLIDACGGLLPEARRVVAGGPMMGFSVTNLAIPITKATAGITVLSASELTEVEQTTCIRCGRCVDVCPLGLVPTKIAHATKFGNLELAKEYDIDVCCECGCCAYVCPSQIPLVQLIRSGKATSAKATSAKATSAKATSAKATSAKTPLNKKAASGNVPS